MVSEPDLSSTAVCNFCRRWKIRSPAVFGSYLRTDFGPDSDIGLLADFEPNPGWSLLDHMRMEAEIARIVGRRVDLVSRRAVEASRNPVRRDAILSSARLVHVF